MKIYKLHADDGHYRSVMALDARDKEAYLFTKIGIPIAATHKPIPVKIHIVDNRKVKTKAQSQLKGDLYGFGGNAPVYGEHAVDVLGDKLREYGELLLLIGDNGAKYYAYRCTNRKDEASDQAEAERRRIASGSILDSYICAFKPEIIGDDEIFCTKPEGTFYTDKFKHRVEEAGLKGGKFIEVWSDENT
jgi:hypothetical protein